MRAPLACLLAITGWTYFGGQALANESVEGFLAVRASSEAAQLAIEIEVPEGHAITGVQWSSNEQSPAPTVTAVAATPDGMPDLDGDRMASYTAAEIEGSATAERVFVESIGSENGSVFIVFEFDVGNAEPDQTGGGGAGVAYGLGKPTRRALVASGGQEWLALDTRVDVLLEPVFVKGAPEAILSASSGGVFQAAESSEPVAIQAEQEVPRLSTRLVGATPNPFNPSTVVSFELAATERVQLAIYNVRGARVRVLATATFPAGRHLVTWDGVDEVGRSVASGVYYARMMAGDVRQTARLVLVK